MRTAKGWLQLLREEQEKVLALASTVALVAGAAKALFSKSAPPVLWLTVCSLLLIAAGIWMLVQWRRGRDTPSQVTKPYSNRDVVVAWSAGAVVLALAWGVVYRERILYADVP